MRLWISTGKAFGAAALLGLLGHAAFAEAPSGADASRPVPLTRSPFVPRRFVTRHRLTLDGRELRYTAIAGDTVVADRDGVEQAAIFTVSYVVDGAESAAQRPILFLFNGGPGSSAVCLHLAAFGPRRILFPADPVNPGAPPYPMVDNPDTLLPYADLVFVDPVGTGYSRALGEHRDDEFWGVDEDARVLAEFIRSYLTTNRRWASPKYLVGESYGTVRASLLVRELALRPLEEVFLNGVVLISSATDVRTFLNGGPNNELPFVTDLPTLVATAHYHHALPGPEEDLEALLAEAEEFAGGDYLTALFAGDALPDARRRRIAERLHRFSGLSVEYLLRSNLRIDKDRYLKELLRDRGQTLGLHDTRYVGRDADAAGEYVAVDPFLTPTNGPFVTATPAYLADELGVALTEPYVIFSMTAAREWKRAADGTRAFAGFLNTTPYLAEAAATNAGFRIFVASGLYDLATPYLGMRYTFSQSGIDRARIQMRRYAAGHMMYLDPPSLHALNEDLRSFLRAGGD